MSNELSILWETFNICTKQTMRLMQIIKMNIKENKYFNLFIFMRLFQRIN